MPEFKENDLVFLVDEVPGVPYGSIGTIVHVYKNKRSFEVEFPLTDIPVIVMLGTDQFKRKGKAK